MHIRWWKKRLLPGNLIQTLLHGGCNFPLNPKNFPVIRLPDYRGFSTSVHIILKQKVKANIEFGFA